jgi:hypothetical protein
MIPVVNGLKGQYIGKVTFKSLNATEGGKTVFEQLSLRGHPAVVLFDAERQEVYRSFGVITEDILRVELEKVVSDD